MQPCLPPRLWDSGRPVCPRGLWGTAASAAGAADVHGPEAGAGHGCPLGTRTGASGTAVHPVMAGPPLHLLGSWAWSVSGRDPTLRVLLCRPAHLSPPPPGQVHGHSVWWRPGPQKWKMPGKQVFRVEGPSAVLPGTASCLPPPASRLPAAASSPPLEGAVRARPCTDAQHCPRQPRGLCLRASTPGFSPQWTLRFQPHVPFLPPGRGPQRTGLSLETPGLRVPTHGRCCRVSAAGPPSGVSAHGRQRGRVCCPSGPSSTPPPPGLSGPLPQPVGGESPWPSGSPLGACPGPSLPPARPGSRLRAAGLSRPPLGPRRQSGGSGPSTKPHCSPRVLPGRGAFFSSDSAARAWEGPGPRLWDCDQGFWREIPLGPHGGRRRAPGLAPGRARIREGRAGSGGGAAAAATCCRVGAGRLGETSPSCSRSGVGGKWTGNRDGRAGLHGDGHPVDSGSRVRTRILNSAGQAWQSPRCQARGRCGPGRGCTPSPSLPDPQPQNPSAPSRDLPGVSGRGPSHTGQVLLSPWRGQPCPGAGDSSWFLGTGGLQGPGWAWSLTAAVGTQEALGSPQQHTAVFNYSATAPFLLISLKGVDSEEVCPATDREGPGVEARGRPPGPRPLGAPGKGRVGPDDSRRLPGRSQRWRHAPCDLSQAAPPHGSPRAGQGQGPGPRSVTRHCTVPFPGCQPFQPARSAHGSRSSLSPSGKGQRRLG